MNPPAPGSSFTDLQKKARLRLLRMHFESNAGHLGGNLSSIDIMLCLYHQTLKLNDVFILSKGHAAGALYTTLWTVGKLTEEDLSTFHKDGTILSGHPPVNRFPEIKFATGSLGHGFSLAAGIAMAKKIKQETGRVFCLTSDGEWNEGSCWEALIFSKHQKLNNLTLIVDANGLQGFGTTKEVANLDSMAEKFKSFNIPVAEINGHDIASITKALEPKKEFNVVIAKTIKGKGVSFMENKMEWHYLPLKDDQYNHALRELS